MSGGRVDGCFLYARHGPSMGLFQTESSETSISLCHELREILFFRCVLLKVTAVFANIFSSVP